ncbi:hypothetical protein AK88_01235 [Plasmodium fragile]|uniref:Uncharacterized protein n=1 Tax=Plasmodium fragile TaxID=5857 RepID=A0A0D9QQ28_PLAFR|nr:uncharacterized protein AK88_01235 [Plasmodium fragile]KJP89149.1 hypothetical protein AK88_01235 [Plasmodium fragile]
MMQYPAGASLFAGGTDQSGRSDGSGSGSDGSDDRMDVDMGKDMHVCVKSTMMEPPIPTHDTEPVKSHTKHVQAKDEAAIDTSSARNANVLCEHGKGHMSKSVEEGVNTGSVVERGEEDILLSLLKMKDLVADHIIQKGKNEKCYMDQINDSKNYLRQTMEQESRNEDSSKMFRCGSEYNGYSQLLDSGLAFTHVKVVSGVMIHTFKCFRHVECVGGEAFVLTTGSKSLYTEIFIKGNLCILKKEPMLQNVNCVVKRYQWTFFENCYNVRSGRNRAIAMGYKYFNSSTSARRYVRNFICGMKKRCISRLRVINYKGTKNTWIEFNSTYHEKNCLFYRPWEWDNEERSRTKKSGGNGFNKLASHGKEKKRNTRDGGGGMERPAEMMKENQMAFYNNPVISTSCKITHGRSSFEQDLRSGAEQLNATSNWGNDNGVTVLLEHAAQTTYRGQAAYGGHRAADAQNNFTLIPPSLNRQLGAVTNRYSQVYPCNGSGGPPNMSQPNQVRPVPASGQGLATRYHRGAHLNGKDAYAKDACGKDAYAKVFLPSGECQREGETLRKHGPRGTTGMYRIYNGVDTTRLLPLEKENGPKEYPSMGSGNIQGEVDPSVCKRVSSGAINERLLSTRTRGQKKKKKMIIEEIRGEATRDR